MLRLCTIRGEPMDSQTQIVYLDSGLPDFPEVLRRLSEGEMVSDREFDRVFINRIRDKSFIHWTPVGVARRAAEMLSVDDSSRILDVGSGPGKFCIVGSLTTEATYVGVEQRPHLADFASALVRRHGLPRVSFLNCQMEQMDWSQFTGFYLYNPFVELLYQADHRIDDTIEAGGERYVGLVRFVQIALSRLEPGTRVVTFHGFGGDMPPNYDLVCREKWGADYLACWEKVI